MPFLHRHPALHLFLAFSATVHAAIWLVLCFVALVSQSNERMLEPGFGWGGITILLLGSSIFTAIAFFITTWCRFRMAFATGLLTANLLLLAAR